MQLHAFRRQTTIILLILAVIPYLFIVPLLCGPAKSSLSEEENCQMLSLKMIILRIMLSKISSMFILPEAITCPNPTEGFTFLKDISAVFYIPILSFAKDKPPRFL